MDGNPSLQRLIVPHAIILNEPISGRCSRLYCSNEIVMQKRNSTLYTNTCIIQLAINPINERRETSGQPRKAGDSGGV